MPKILIVPDVHGRTFWRYALDHVEEYDKVIFLGDYLDPYPHEGISFNESVNNFNDILDFKEDYYDKVELLLGNHDMHYVSLGFMDCSRLNYKHRDEIHELYVGFKDYFKLAHSEADILFSHAGIYKEWLGRYEITIDDILNQHVRHASLEAISSLRGGCDPVGSCIWADIRESLNHEINTDYYQIVGHTQLTEEPYITDKIACLDVRRCFELDTDTKKIISVDNNNEINENSSN